MIKAILSASDECIDFTMLCVFFLCLCTRERVEIMLLFQTLGVVSDSKMNLVGALGCIGSFFEFPNSFQKRREKPKKKKKNKEKREFLLPHNPALLLLINIALPIGVSRIIRKSITIQMSSMLMSNLLVIEGDYKDYPFHKNQADD
ncbi:Uncharacterized protein FWK35_00010560 [Aphis craccivora]|uniref:Uncharacterized protein n=1 Tax=Aphis craccivora TaxID=307492 RepID=A0A6G0ZE49_APHCR|nr:Uncharacterized protein FWK35_00010560 [Aphis craccivora]